MSVFGLPFFAAGIFMFLSLAGVVPTKGIDSSAATRVVLPLMALAFTAVGATLVFGRAWTAIDRAEGTLEHQWGLLVAMHTKATRFGDGLAIAIGFNPGDSDSAETFPLTLKSSSAGQQKIFTASTYADARECATAIARLLNVEVEDATSDHAVRVAASKSALSLSERLRLDGPDQGPMPRPSNMRSEVRMEGHGVRMTIPAAPTHPFLIVATLVPVAIVAAVFGPVSEFFDRTKTPAAIGWTFFGLFALLFAVIPGMTVINAIVRARRGATIVTVSPNGIRIDERGAWRTTTTGAYDAGDVYDVDYGTTESTMASARRSAMAIARESDGMARPTAVTPGLERVLTRIVAFSKTKGITLKTRRGLVSIGAGLDDAEILYLHAVIRRALVGSPRL
jgi:hypothetical protein